MWEKTKKLTDFALVAAFLGFIFTVLVMTYTGPVQKAVEGTKYTFASYKDLSKRFEGILQENLFQKYEFINLNGGMARYLGMNSLNKRQRLSNGFLAYFADRRDTTKSSKKVVALNNFLSDRGIPFLYVLAPSKESIYDVQYAPGYGSNAKQNIVNMITALNAGGVNTLNMDDWFKENGWHTEDVFFKTDHHWKPEAAFAATNVSLAFMKKNFGIKYDNSMMNYDIWTIDNYTASYLGSHGRRVGTKYAGVDDLQIIYRKDQSEVELSYLRKGTTNWTYRNSVFDMTYLKRIDYYKLNPYSSYIGGDYPIVNIKNKNALNNLKIIVVGDSFRLPVETFLSSYFSELYHIDLRYYTDGAFVQYVEEIQPDMVIMYKNINGIGGDDYEFGLESYLKQLERTSENTPIQEVGNIEVRAEEKDKNNFAVVCGNLEPNQAYTLTVDGTSLSGAKNMFVQMTLQNLSTNKAIYNRYFEPNSDRRQKWIFTTPAKVEDTYGIYLYAGTKGRTAKINVKAEGIRLRKGVFED